MNCGQRVRDQISGFEGVVVAKTEWLNGCVRLTIQPQKLHEGKPIEAQTFDVEQLELVDDSQFKPMSRTGGPMPAPTRQGNPTR